MAGVKVKPAAAYVIAAEPVVLVDPTTGAPYSATGGGGGGGDASAANQVIGNDHLAAIKDNTTAYDVVRTITPGTPVAAGKAVLINCTTAGVFTLTVGGASVALNLVAGVSFIDKLAATNVALSGGAAGTVHVLDI